MTIRLIRHSSEIVHIIIDNPKKKNALSVEIFRNLAMTWQELASDNRVRAVVISGEESSGFSTGADLSVDWLNVEDIDALIDKALLKTFFFPKPIIAAIDGYCLAGGLELVLSSDIRIATAEATFGFPEVKWAVIPSGGGTMKLIDQIGVARAMDLLLTGKTISATEALEVGIVNKIVGRGDLLTEAFQLAMNIARNSPLAVAATKRLAFERLYKIYKAQEALEQKVVNELRYSGEHIEGKMAFCEKREPIY
jgi:enoyl-CoA hydratase